MSCLAPRRLRLQRLFSSFPEGWPGIGLIFLRVIVALHEATFGASLLMATNSLSFKNWIPGLLAVAIGFALLIGFLTPLVSALATIGYLAMGVSSFLAANPIHPSGSLKWFDLAAVSIALVLLGPGAFSLDGRLFGRREIIIPASRRPSRE